MSTYKQLQQWVKENYGFLPKSCWIADVKEKHGIIIRKAPNRHDESKRGNPCPENKVKPIEEAFKYYRLI
ncbi:hypothetical protein GGQ84_000181 [Desulfitispora alkaliphila]|uniref:hypothetical protein n=1 Tax=Desulfitispora alkaliphila TaxID=622674 RepID=UPI003D1F5C27